MTNDKRHRAETTAGAQLARGEEPAQAQPRLYPFGLPDGKPGNADDDPLGDFVPLGGRGSRRGLGMEADERRVRIIVGRKGAGKTLYLRRLQAEAENNPSLYVDKWQFDMPPTQDIVQVFDCSRSVPDAVERWARIWRRAILRSVLSHMRYAPKLRPLVGDTLVGRPAEQTKLWVDHGACSSPYQEAHNIVFERDHSGSGAFRSSLDNYLGDPGWTAIEELVGELLGDCPSPCFYLDALDDYFENVPRKWLACQKGLAVEVLRLADKWPHLHVVITIRDIVYTALMASEHATRLIRNERIRTLDWDERAIEELLRVKIDNLEPDYLACPESEDPIERWLGMTRISNRSSDQDRRAEQEVLTLYLLRHTRLIPRDIVQLRNALCVEIDRARDRGEGLDEEQIQRTVSEVAASAGREELLIVANHITSGVMPRWSVEMGIDEVYYRDMHDGDAREGATWQHFVRDRLIDLLRELKEDRLTGGRLANFAARCTQVFGDVDVVSILWQHGLLGYIEPGQPRRTGRSMFFTAVTESPMHLPSTHRAYVLHPIMIDTIGKPMKGIGDIVRAY
jgi:hypothetical protein